MVCGWRHFSGHVRSSERLVTTHHSHVANACLPAGQSPNKKPIFISDISDTRSFLAWFRVSCPGGLMAHLNGEKLMVFPSTADVFQTAVCALRSPNGKKGASFHTFTLPEDRCVRLLVKNKSRNMLQSVVREELDSLNIHVQGVTQLRFGRRDQDPAKVCPPNPHLIITVGRVPDVLRCDHSPYSPLVRFWESHVARKARCNISPARASATRSVTASTHPGSSLVKAPTSLVNSLQSGFSLSAVAAGETTQRITEAV